MEDACAFVYTNTNVGGICTQNFTSTFFRTFIGSEKSKSKQKINVYGIKKGNYKNY